MNYTIIGFGGRGSLYAQLFSRIGGVKLAAVCEIIPERLEKAGRLYGLPKDKLFLSDKEFASAGKLGDLCIVSTQDGQHKEHALMMLGAGYDLLLEKPIATNFGDCQDIHDKAKALNRRVFICHVLRYAPFYSVIKRELESGAYGRIAVLNLTENIAYWHFAHSYVRGSWSAVPPSAPMIIAKTCHDLDIISWFMGAECKSVSSVGSLGFFMEENAPEGSSDRCFSCAVRADCPYDAERFYITERLDKGHTVWPVAVLCEVPTRERVEDALKIGPYGRCVWRCGNNAVDRQTVNMEFKGGAIANLTATAFSKDCYREIHIHCEKGEIFGDMIDNILTCSVYGKESKTIDVNETDDSFAGHGGGDAKMVADVAAVYGGGSCVALTTIENSMQSHAIGFAAEESRQNGGKLVTPFKL